MLRFTFILPIALFLTACGSSSATYTNDQAHFSFHYPSQWKIESIAQGVGQPYRQQIVSGSEGRIEVTWGNGLGGACGENGHEKELEKILIGSKEMDVCHTTDNSGVESWRLISWQATAETGATVDVYANAPSAENSPVMRQILSTFTFEK